LKITKTLKVEIQFTGHSRSLEIDIIRQITYDFVFTFHSNFGASLYRFCRV